MTRIVPIKVDISDELKDRLVNQVGRYAAVQALLQLAAECDEIQRIGQTPNRDISREDREWFGRSPLLDGEATFSLGQRPVISAWLRERANQLLDAEVDER